MLNAQLISRLASFPASPLIFTETRVTKDSLKRPLIASAALKHVGVIMLTYFYNFSNMQGAIFEQLDVLILRRGARLENSSYLNLFIRS